MNCYWRILFSMCILLYSKICFMSNLVGRHFFLILASLPICDNCLIAFLVFDDLETFIDYCYCLFLRVSRQMMLRIHFWLCSRISLDRAGGSNGMPEIIPRPTTCKESVPLLYHHSSSKLFCILSFI